MKLSTAILTSIVIGTGAGAYTYYTGAYRLKFDFAGIGVQGQQVMVELAVYNPSGFFTYPIPQMFMNVYDKQGRYFGVLYSNQYQWVKPGQNRIRAYVVANVQAVVQSLAALVVPGATLDLLLDGNIQVGGHIIPFKIPIHQTLSL